MNQTIGAMYHILLQFRHGIWTLNLLVKNILIVLISEVQSLFKVGASWVSLSYSLARSTAGRRFVDSLGCELMGVHRGILDRTLKSDPSWDSIVIPLKQDYSYPIALERYPLNPRVRL